MFSQVFVCPQGVGISGPMSFSRCWVSLVRGPLRGWGWICRGMGKFWGWVCPGGTHPTDMGPRQYISCQNISVLSVHNNKSENYVVIFTKIMSDYNKCNNENKGKEAVVRNANFALLLI